MDLTAFPTSDTVEELDKVKLWASHEDIDIETTPFQVIYDLAKSEVKERPAFWRDISFWRGLGFLLGANIIFSLMGGLLLAVMQIPIPDFLVANISTSLGIIAGLFAASVRNG